MRTRMLRCLDLPARSCMIRPSHRGERPTGSTRTTRARHVASRTRRVSSTITSGTRGVRAVHEGILGGTFCTGTATSGTRTVRHSISGGRAATRRGPSRARYVSRPTGRVRYSIPDVTTSTRVVPRSPCVVRRSPCVVLRSSCAVPCSKRVVPCSTRAVPCSTRVVPRPVRVVPPCARRVITSIRLVSCRTGDVRRRIKR